MPAYPHPCPCRRETADNWDAEIAEDVGSECQKYGPVEHVFVDRNSRGFVYVVSHGKGLREGSVRQSGCPGAGQ